MQKNLLAFLLLVNSFTLFPQEAKEFSNEVFLKTLNSDISYTNLRKKIVSEFKNTPPGHWGEFVKGVKLETDTRQKSVALTFDACGTIGGNGYDKELIEFLSNEKIPSTLFVSGKWIDSNFAAFLKLAGNPLFEIENHGLNHKPCSVCGESAYGIRGTQNAGQAFDEIEANARKIELLTKHSPVFYRSATAFTDEACVAIAAELNITVVSYNVLSGDALSSSSAALIEKNVLKSIKPGAVVIMHFNHPEGNTFEALKKIVSELRKQGYSFVRLDQTAGRQY